MKINASATSIDLQPYYLQINSTCNQRCVFCRYYSDADSLAAGPESIIAQLKSLRNDRLITSATFTGGEPTINPNLIKYIQTARGLNFSTIGMETNGLMLSYPKYANSLVEAGLTHVRITMICGEASLSDELSLVPGGWSLTRKGISWASQNNLNTIIQVPLLLPTIDTLPDHMELISDEYPGICGVELRVLDPETEAFAEIPISILESSLNKARKTLRKEVKMMFQASRGPAPCLFSEPETISSVFNLPAAAESEKPDYAIVQECSRCLISCVCPGVHPKYIHPARTQPGGNITPQLARKLLRPGPGGVRLPLADRKRRGKANFCTFSMASDSEGNSYVREAMLRINYNCNQRCLFCWIEPGYDNLPRDAVVRKIAEFKSMGLKTVSITGGEPTLNSNLESYIRLIREAGVREICLQTNAELLSEEARVVSLVRAGLNSAFVSLHSHMPDISDLITGSEGGFLKTVAGIKNLIANRAIVFLSHVINSFNYKQLPEFVEFVSEAFQRVPIIFSYAAPIHGAIMHRGLIPQLNEIRTPLIDALEKCYELKVPFSGLAGMCGVPPCILGGNLRFYPDINRVAETDGGDDMLKVDRCKSCSLNDFCFGLRRNYADIYGVEELHAVFIENVKPTVLDYIKPEDFFRQMVSSPQDKP